MAGTPQTIVLKAGISGEPIVSEALGAEPLTPGALAQILPAGTIRNHSDIAKNSNKLFVLENIPIGGTIDTVYPIGNSVRYGRFQPGQGVLARLAANAPAILEGDALESAGDGTLRKVVTDIATDETQRDATVAYAGQSIDNSANGSIVRIQAIVA